MFMYTVDGKGKDCATNQDTDENEHCFSIKKLMDLQLGFVNEITLLQFHAQKLGVKVDCTPKCHPELAGEGIGYSWAL